MNKRVQFALLCSLALVFSTPLRAENKAGISLQFDDDFFSQWCTLRSFFNTNNMKITFFITRPNHLTKEKKECLQNLIRDGHEIGAHGYEHKNPKDYITDYGLEAYIHDEIEQPLSYLADLEIFPLSYSTPWGGDTPELVTSLNKYFFIQRSTTSTRSQKNLYEWKKETFIRGAPIDIGKSSDEDIEKNIIKAKYENKVSILYAHRILPESTKSYITFERLQLILKIAKEQNLSFYRFSELWFKDEFSKHKEGSELVYQFYTQGSKSIATDILNNKWKLSSRFPTVELPDPTLLTWNENPLHENYWRFIFYSLRPLKDLLYAFNVTKDDKYIEKMLEILNSFLNKGIQSSLWQDPHTAAYLGLSLVYYEKNLKKLGFITNEMENKVIKALDVISQYLREEKNFEINNHGVTESLALIAISINFPNLQNSFSDFNLGRTRFLTLLNKIIDQSGVEIEQSPFYHFYTMKEFWDAYNFAKKTSIFRNANLEEKIKKMVDFASYITQPNGDVPLIGSSVFLNIQSPTSQTLKEIGNEYSQFKHILTKGKEGTPASPASKLFKEGGFSILASEPTWLEKYEDKIHVVFDVGPYRTNHSHFDALSVNIYGHGQTIFPDSGLYSYEISEQKTFYSSPAAHNLTTVDNEQQIKGSAVPITFWQNNLGSYQSGFHDLYKNFRTKRGVLLLKNNSLVIIDELKPIKNQKDHFFHLYWHLNPKADIHPLDSENRQFSITTLGEHTATLTFCLPTSGNINLTRGQLSPRQGWYSSTYEKEEPNWVLDFRHQGQDFRMITLIDFDENKSTQNCEALWQENNLAINISSPSSPPLFGNIKNFASEHESIEVSNL